MKRRDWPSREQSSNAFRAESKDHQRDPAEFLNAKPREIKSFLRGQVASDRTQESQSELPALFIGFESKCSVAVELHFVDPASDRELPNRKRHHWLDERKAICCPLFSPDLVGLR
jgi:hypothetical protein